MNRGIIGRRPRFPTVEAHGPVPALHLPVPRLPPELGTTLIIEGLIAADGVAGTELFLRFNNNDESLYHYQFALSSDAAVAGNESAGAQTRVALGGIGNEAQPDGYTVVRVEVPFFGGRSHHKSLLAQLYEPRTLATTQTLTVTGGIWLSTAPIALVSLFPSTGLIASRSRLRTRVA